jgi:hypothetical protein
LKEFRIPCNCARTLAGHIQPTRGDSFQPSANPGCLMSVMIPSRAIGSISQYLDHRLPLLATAFRNYGCPFAPFDQWLRSSESFGPFSIWTLTQREVEVWTSFRGKGKEQFQVESYYTVLVLSFKGALTGNSRAGNCRAKEVEVIMSYRTAPVSVRLSIRSRSVTDSGFHFWVDSTPKTHTLTLGNKTTE